jgi:xylulokinase
VRRVFLGIDCGTQSTKVVLRDASDGEIVRVGRAAHDIVERDDGTREQDPNWWTAALVAAAREALRGDRVEIAGIGVSGQQHGLVTLDARDQPVRPAKLWNDTATAPQSAELTERLGGPERALALTGNLPLPGYTAPKILWSRQREPDAYARTTRMCLPHDYLNLWLTGTFTTEPGDASGTAYFDARARRYSDAVLGALDDRRDWSRTLPSVRPSLSVIGALRHEAAEALGVRAGVPVSAGGGDNMCAAIGCGITSPGPVALSLGTSGTVFAYCESPAVDPRGEAAAFCDSTGAWLPLACTLNCTSATEWIRLLFALEHRDVDTAVSAGGPTPSFVPYLSGERTPDRPHASGVFVGLRSDHDRAAIIRAVVEGVTFGLRYALGTLRRAGAAPREITLVGGGAASDAWAQLCADVLELLVARPQLVEAAAAGAARQAQWAIDGSMPALAKARTERFEPRRRAEIDERGARWSRLQEAAAANDL